LFTFLDHPDTPRDDNGSARELQPTATYRKTRVLVLPFCTRTTKLTNVEFHVLAAANRLRPGSQPRKELAAAMAILQPLIAELEAAPETIDAEPPAPEPLRLRDDQDDLTHWPTIKSPGV
jgi:hypothetical protein